MSQNIKTTIIITLFALFICVIILFDKLFDNPGPPVTFTSDTGRFSITFPAQPKHFSKYFAADYGKVKITGLTADANGIEFSLTYFDFSSDFPLSSEFFHEDTQIDLSAETFYAKRKTIDHQGRPAVETIAKYLNGYLICKRQIHFQNRRFTLQAVTRKDDKTHIKQIRNFFNSLTFLEKPEE
jgi:hypothetical protein